MVKSNIKPIIVAGAIALIALAVYAVEQKSGPKIVSHTFEFGMLDPNIDIEVLNFRYSDSKQVIAQPDKEYIAMGHIPQADNESTFSTPGDSLYVKWRVISTGKIYEDTVDLKTRLPSDMNGKIIHFNITGPQLYVYLVEGLNYFHASGAPDCPTKLYKKYQCTRIYPDHWKNF